jgi:hypothetical protein
MSIALWSSKSLIGLGTETLVCSREFQALLTDIEMGSPLFNLMMLPHYFKEDRENEEERLRVNY